MIYEKGYFCYFCLHYNYKRKYKGFEPFIKINIKIKDNHKNKK